MLLADRGYSTQRNLTATVFEAWWHQHNKSNDWFLSFYSLERTYITALQQMLSKSITYQKTSIYPSEILLPLGVILSSSALPRQHTQYLMLHEQQKTISMPDCVREWTQIPFVNTPCTNLSCFCEIDVISGLATRLPCLKCHGDVYYTGIKLLLIYVLYFRTWLITF